MKMSNHNQIQSIAVVGAGISGLVLAYSLKKKGYKVTVFESSNKAGGKIRTSHADGFELDLGPVSCAETESLRTLIAELNLESEVLMAQSAVSKRYIFSNRKIHAIEPSPPKLLTHPILSFGARIRLLKDLFIKPSREQIEDETVQQFVSRHFGDEAHQKLFNPVLNGIYAGDSEALSISSTLPLVKRLAKEHGSVIRGLMKEKDKLKTGRKIISMKGGFGKLIEALQKNLNGDVHLSAEVTALKLNEGKPTVTIKENDNLSDQTFDKVFLTLPAYASASLLKDIDAEVSDLLSKIRYTHVHQIYCEVDLNDKKAFDGFGFLVPAEERLSLLGAICISNIFPGKSPEGKKLFALFCGGTRPYPFEARVEDAIKEFNSILKPTAIHMLRVQEWNNAIPQFEVGHQNILKQLKSFEVRTPSISFAGNYVSGVSVGDCIEYASRIS